MLSSQTIRWRSIEVSRAASSLLHAKWASEQLAAARTLDLIVNIARLRAAGKRGSALSLPLAAKLGTVAGWRCMRKATQLLLRREAAACCRRARGTAVVQLSDAVLDAVFPEGAAAAVRAADFLDRSVIRHVVVLRLILPAQLAFCDGERTLVRV